MVWLITDMLLDLLADMAEVSTYFNFLKGLISYGKRAVYIFRIHSRISLFIFFFSPQYSRPIMLLIFLYVSLNKAQKLNYVENFFSFEVECKSLVY